MNLEIFGCRREVGVKEYEMFVGMLLFKRLKQDMEPVKK